MTTALADQLLHYIASCYPDARITDFDFFTSGFESEIFSFGLQLADSLQKYYILRLFSGDGAAKKLVREARGLYLLKEAGFPVPALFMQETDPRILGSPFEIIEKLEGQVLWPILASAKPDHEKQLLSRFGILLAQLHKLDWRLFTDTPDEYHNNPALLLDQVISQYQTLYTHYNLKGFVQIVEWLNTHKNDISIRPAVVHQDFHANNILLGSNDRCFVIDWTQFGVSDYRIDLCWTLLIMGDLGKATWRAPILDAYAAHFNTPIEHLDYFNAIVYMKLLASTVISFTFNPQELGLRSETLTLTREQLLIYKQLSQRLRNITGLTIPELDNVLERIL